MLIYLHGFQSSPRSWKAVQLGQYLAGQARSDYRVPALPSRPMAAADALTQLIEAQQTPLCLIGSSLGGFYSLWLAERYGLPAILINPGIHAARDLGRFQGHNVNPYTGEHYTLNELDLAVWQAMEVPVTRPERYWLMTQEGDEVLNYREGVSKLAGARQTVEAGGDHSFVGFERFFPEILTFAEQYACLPRRG
ncbi:YqiA/YcfP family alpha/beta fold hydrolase [Leeia aquatica]|uniref:Esterase n=1 Tax=Leeia aquatica TaxID=2725557 RepID=A0A847SH60_9NEIS|nr:YqiA/YcfP family alpha/beta fold hydrolase [Leeia aquatica]NLR76618.1 esterase [Leeia aquatica]